LTWPWKLDVRPRLLLLVLILCGGAGPTPTAASPETTATLQMARVVRHLAAVHAGPGPEHALVWRLYEGSQVAVLEEAPGSDGAAWLRIRLWNIHDGWLEAGAVSFDPYPPPPPPAPRPPDAGACQPSASGGQPPRPLAAPAMVLMPTGLGETPDGDSPSSELAAGTSVLADAWAVGADGRLRYRLRAEALEAAGWAAPGTVSLQAADAATRQVGGRPIVEPLSGVGMWFIPDSREYGVDPAARVAAAARASGLSHLYVEVATSRGGFWGTRWLDELLPAARAVGLRVIGSVYACLDDLPADVALALEVARYRTPDGLALDGLTVDLEEKLTPENLQAYGELLRHYLGDDYLLVATTYPPESWFASRYPWPALAASWNAVAPMAYWRQMESRSFTPAEVYAYTRRNVAKVRALAGRPDLPVEMLGQLFEMGRPLLLGPDPPTAGEIEAAATAARNAGAVGISFFDWTRATPSHWEALGRLSTAW
jgi:hypothetical protein